MRLFGKPPNRTPPGGIASVPAGAHMIPVSVKKEYDTVPLHIYHPTPHDAVTLLHLKKDPHDWLVAGWYLDTFRENGKVQGLVYRQVRTDQDKDFILSELKKHDKDANVHFSLDS